MARLYLSQKQTKNSGTEPKAKLLRAADIE